jgi:uncharacterized membrane protein YjdF
MIRKPLGVAVLVECGFIDSPVDAEILRQKENLTKIAAGIANGILRYLGKESSIVEDWMKELGEESIDYLVTQGLIKDPEYWKGKDCRKQYTLLVILVDTEAY